MSRIEIAECAYVKAENLTLAQSNQNNILIEGDNFHSLSFYEFLQHRFSTDYIEASIVQIVVHSASTVSPFSAS